PADEVRVQRRRSHRHQVVHPRLIRPDRKVDRVPLNRDRAATNLGLTLKRLIRLHLRRPRIHRRRNRLTRQRIHRTRRPHHRHRVHHQRLGQPTTRLQRRPRAHGSGTHTSGCTHQPHSFVRYGRIVNAPSGPSGVSNAHSSSVKNNSPLREFSFSRSS